MSVQLRRAGLEDRTGIVDVFLDCWRQSYRGVLPDRLTDSMTDEAATALWNRALTAPDRTVVVATSYGVNGSTGLVQSLYVSPSAQGLGLGRRLLEKAAVDLTKAAATSATLWVFAANTPSVGFYAACGWLPDGVTRVQEEFGEPEIELHKALA